MSNAELSLRDPAPGHPDVAARPAGPAPARITVLDGLRLVAALMVVSYHYVGRSDAWDAAAPHGFPWPVYWAGEYGFLGVELFFLISGFVITLSSIGRGLGDFVIARVVRLYPAYWFAVIATTLVAVALPDVRHALGFSDVLTNLTMLQAPLHVGNVDGVYWTLWCELRFYLLFAVVVWKGVTYRRVVAFCALWTVAALVTIATGNAFMQVVFMPEQAPYFIAGVAFFLIYRYGSHAVPWGIAGMAFLIGVHLLGTDPMIKNKFGRVPAWFAIVLIACFFVVIALIALGKLGYSWRWLTVAGSLTYPLYLMHQHIGWAIIEKLQHRMPAPLLASLVLAAMLALAYGVHRLVEKPVAARMRQALRSSAAGRSERHADRAVTVAGSPAGVRPIGAQGTPAASGTGAST